MEKFNQSNKRQRRKIDRLIEKMSNVSSDAEFLKIDEQFDEISLFCTVEQAEKIRELCQIIDILPPKLRIIP